jgi:signal transduction histidine kinase
MEPLEQLNQATDRIKAGNLSYRIDSQGIVQLRELEELARSFNSMAERLEALDQAKRDFLMMISHEIKNPMAALKEGLSLLTAPEKENRKLSPEAHKRCVSACQIASKRLEYMINNLLSLSRSETGMFKFDLTQQNFVLAVQSSVAEVRPLADKKGMQIQVSCPENIRISFDREAMVQALVNLLLNAIKYGSENSTIEVQVSAEPAHGVEVSVTNIGKVIAPSELTRVFDRFYRGQNSGSQQGMGIGLHVVKKVVEAHKGFVSALSEAGRTQMIVNLPGEL